MHLHIPSLDVKIGMTAERYAMINSDQTHVESTSSKQDEHEELPYLPFFCLNLNFGIPNLKYSSVNHIHNLLPLLSSSSIEYGQLSLMQDTAEIEQLIYFLINEEASQGVMLMGHSSGCQNIVHYLRRRSSCSKGVRGVILQAPVSDREYRATIPETLGLFVSSFV
ncbi:hypothetical protein MPTK1_4g12590 [Marchantia polymorpha subsp. ruderalis]|uniref:Uncharacterized protein n=2 Tax=Marchantia polymorpha TaxID=3197 RepID=A0AAF6B984_MARPO|nr:hypothetical protein MARPO_0174s0021 [Marchantia polymorpha]BBN08568.1 hypothetical protein Mp_4g12590 [Marchantia polymorpha subsp. ruderalis]|eukprot:PTQ28094.1 hypothetical protein MARPO_0174s0021 [Marchantia polymorpha]